MKKQIITEQENSLRGDFFFEKDMKAYIGHIKDGDKVIWREEYVKWLENKYFKMLDVIEFIGRADLYKENGTWMNCDTTVATSDEELIDVINELNKN
jgi:hypothetical protein